MMTGQYKQSLKHALRVLKDGDKLLTKPEEIIEKCHRSMMDHHNADKQESPNVSDESDSANMADNTYPWERKGALDPFTLETAAHDGPY